MRLVFDPAPLLALGPLLRLAVEDRRTDFGEQRPRFHWERATIEGERMLVVLVGVLGDRVERTQLDAHEITKERLAAAVYLLWRDLQVNYRRTGKRRKA